MGPVPIYTSTAPEPEPSSPSAVALYMQSHKRHLTKSPFLPYLHKSGAASTTQGVTRGSQCGGGACKERGTQPFLRGLQPTNPGQKKLPEPSQCDPSTHEPAAASTSHNPAGKHHGERALRPKAASPCCNDTASIGAPVRDAPGSPGPQLQVSVVSAEDLAGITAEGLFCTDKWPYLQPPAYSRVKPPSRK